MMDVSYSGITRRLHPIYGVNQENCYSGPMQVTYGHNRSGTGFSLKHDRNGPCLKLGNDFTDFENKTHLLFTVFSAFPRHKLFDQPIKRFWRQLTPRYDGATFHSIDCLSDFRVSWMNAEVAQPSSYTRSRGCAITQWSSSKQDMTHAMSENNAVLLVVEDEPLTRSQLTAHFENENHSVIARESADDIGQLIKSRDVDVCLIDINLPGKDGLTLTREIRTWSNVGVILVTGKTEQIDKIVGLESGADDSVTKPFDPRELLFRVNNLVRRVRSQQKDHDRGFIRRFESWSLDLNKRELRTPGDEVQSLSAGEFHLLLALIDNAGQVTTRDQLMNRIRNREWYPDDRYIDVLVGQVRRKFRKHDRETTFINTIHGTGYLFAPAVS